MRFIALLSDQVRPDLPTELAQAGVAGIARVPVQRQMAVPTLEHPGRTPS